MKTQLFIFLSFASAALLGANWPAPPAGYAYETDLRPHSLVLTNATAAGLANAADIATATNAIGASLASLAVYYPEGNVTSLSQITTTGLEFGEWDSINFTCTLTSGLNATGDVVIPYEVEHNGAMYKVAAISSDAFREVSITSLVAPTTVISIGDNAFTYCHYLASASFPNVINIGVGAFFLCNNLASVSFPSATSIRNAAFNSCLSLTSISLPSATSIGGSAFNSCASLVSVDFGTTPRTISLNMDAFSGTPTSCTILLPMGAYTADWQNLKAQGYNVRCYADAADVVPAPAVTNIARAVVNSVWDDALGVSWQAKMHDGALYYIAVTNSQEVAE